MMTDAPKRLMLFSQQTVGLGARKTSMVFLAEAFAGLGYQVSLVTTQLSWLTRLRRDNKLTAVPASRCNRWYAAGRLHGFVWVPPLHPLSAGRRLLQTLTAPLVSLYGRLLPASILDEVRAADIVVIESCAAVALFEQLKAAAPDAAFIYSMSDRLGSVGMHPGLQRVLERTAPAYDLVRVPARALVADLPGANAVFVPHGIDKRVFDQAGDTPYESGPNAVLIGDMMLDRHVLDLLTRSYPQVHFHYFGRTALGLEARPNLRAWGEQPFERLVPFVKFADVGLSLYRHEPGLEYLAESSLKNIQYDYCGLPIVAPAFVNDGRRQVFAYQPTEPETAVDAMAAALQRGRSVADRPQVGDWTEVAQQMLRLLPERR